MRSARASSEWPRFPALNPSIDLGRALLVNYADGAVRASHCTDAVTGQIDTQLVSIMMNALHSLVASDIAGQACSGGLRKHCASV